jgi:hypothetical protein
MPEDATDLPDLKLVASVATNIYYDVTKTNELRLGRVSGTNKLVSQPRFDLQPQAYIL